MLWTGVVGTSRKENERRVPIHPRHLAQLPAGVRSRLVFEEGYGRRFGVSDRRLGDLVGRLAPRSSVLADCELVILPKPLPDDLREVREGGILWGWPHCIQQRETTQVAIDRRLTLVAFESMYQWREEQRDVHVFHMNNELAGYCAVLDALRLAGTDGYYGPSRRAVILSFGSVSRGAAYALLGRGYADLRCFTQRPAHLVAYSLPAVRYGQMRRRPEGGMEALFDGTRRPLVEELAEADIVVNGILQDPEDPVFFLLEGEEEQLAPGTLIIDVSCDAGMGFPFARPTTFEEPVFRVGDAFYYGVDHTPSYLWRAASWEISVALLPYLETVMRGPEAWADDVTVRKAVEIAGGRVINPTILAFQERAAEYPHRPLGEAG